VLDRPVPGGGLHAPHEGTRHNAFIALTKRALRVSLQIRLGMKREVGSVAICDMNTLIERLSARRSFHERCHVEDSSRFSGCEACLTRRSSCTALHRCRRLMRPIVIVDLRRLGEEVSAVRPTLFGLPVGRVDTASALPAALVRPIGRWLTERAAALSRSIP
jgi:hypothetical protein